MSEPHQSAGADDENWGAAPTSGFTKIILLLEVALTFAIYFLYAASPPPNVNESHYLAKAKHYWNPQWCPNDLFLDSADAHLLFYWTLGWLTLFCSMATVAWIGRIIVWMLTAIAWTMLSRAVLPVRFLAPITAGIALVLMDRFHMAGEWMIGGIEAKGFAYPLVIVGVALLVRDRWKPAWLCFGAAAAFHVLIGGWSVVAAAVAWLAVGRRSQSLVGMTPWLLGGFVISLAGLVPAFRLSSETAAQQVDIANQIYVYGRLDHHLIFSAFDIDLVIRHGYLAAAWITLFCLQVVLIRRWMKKGADLKKGSDALTQDSKPDEPLSIVENSVADIMSQGSDPFFKFKSANQNAITRLNCFVLGTVIIALAGIGIDQIILVWQDNRPLAARLLRFYWFRMSDILVPIGATFSAFCLVNAFRQAFRRAPRRRIASNLLLITTALFAIAIIGWSLYQIHQQRVFDPRSRADQKSLPLDEEFRALALQRHADWIAACEWISDNTPADAAFFTPRAQQTFKWYAGRDEVVNGKDVPQDAARIVQWQTRFQELHPSIVEYPTFVLDGRVFGLLAYDDISIKELADRYSATYAIVDRESLDSRNGFLPTEFERIFPTGEKKNKFAVLKLIGN